MRWRRRWKSVSEPYNVDGPTSDVPVYMRRQMHLPIKRNSLPQHRSPLVKAYTAPKKTLSPFPGQQEDSMSDYFPPIELMRRPSRTAGLHTLNVGNLDPTMTTERITSMFETLRGFMPSFVNAKIMEHPQTHESLGYAIVYFEDERDQQ